MSQQAWNAPDFQGLTPGVEPRRSDKLFVLNGRNFIFDSIGPKSIFGSRFLTPYPLGQAEHVQGMRLKLGSQDRVFTFTPDSILEWNEMVGTWQVIYLLANTAGTPARWTQGYLNGRQFFAHPAVGILEYNLTTGRVVKADYPGLPENVIGIVVNNGRLCAINTEFLFWSATSDGTDWVPRLGGAGFQRISDRVSGFPIALTTYTEGTLTWTTGGVMRSQFTGDEAVYRHRALNTDYRPINSFCTIRIDDNTVIILDERGLFQSRGDIPTPFSPLFNEFLIAFIQDNDLSKGQNVRLEWDELQRYLYVSVSQSFDSPVYETAFVLYPPLDKWGQFNLPHFGILPLKIATGSRADDYYGFVDTGSRINYWIKAGSREVIPDDLHLDSYRPVLQKPVGKDSANTAVAVSSTAKANTIPTASMVGVAGYYVPGGTTLPMRKVAGLSASIQLGLIRFDLSETVDQLTEVIQLQLSNTVAGDINRVNGNYTLVPAQPVEWVGIEDENFVNCEIRVLSTLDGRSVFNECEPDLIGLEKGIRYYSCSTVGVWHILELSAAEVGQAFHVHSFGMTATYAGKLG